MTNAQFYAALGVPFLMFLISTLANRSAILNLGKRIDDLRTDMGRRFEDVNQRLGDFNRRFDDINQRFGDMNQRLQEMSHRMDRIEAKLDAIDTEIRINHDRRLAALEARLFERAS